jgi:DNA polymerase III epsilon subunit-like protein
MSVLKIISDSNCSVRCDFQEVGDIEAGELFKLQLKKGCYILEFLVEDIVICSMDYTIETNDEEPLLRLNLKEQAEKKIMERQFALVYSEDGRTIISCNKTVEGELIVPDGIEHIANCAFEDSKVTSLVISDSVKIIGDCAFSGCSGMTSITIGNGVTNIGNRAFYGCCGLSTIIIPNSVINIGNAAPIDYSGLAPSRANLNKQIAIGAFEDCSGLTSITIGNKVTSIGNRTFCGCHRLTSVTIPNSVTSIGDEAFKNCSDLVSVMIPNSVKSIGDYVFEGCDRLTSVIIPNSVTRIGIGAFLVNQNIPDFLKGKGYNFFHKGGLTYPLYNATLFACMPTLYNKSSYIIPDGIKEICGGAFDGCSALVSVIIPNSVTKIGDRAFFGCSRLTSIVIPNSVKAIGHGAFDECFRLTSVTIPNSVISIGEMVFHDCSGLTSPVHNATLFAYMPTSFSGPYHIPDGIKEVCGGAFWCCRDLTSVTIPNSVTSIGWGAFAECSGLTSITIPNNVTSIGDEAFSGCSRLTSVTIPNSVTSIGSSAFAYCSGLTSITIPNSVTSIGDFAFEKCSGLTFVTIPNSVTSIGGGIFDECYELKKIIIPKGTRGKFEKMLPNQKDKLVEQEQMAKKGTKDRIVFFDTETTGVPLNYKAPSSDTNNWPRLVQLAWILTDEESNRIHTGNLIVKPDGFMIPADAANVHGITTQKAKEEGVPLVEAIEQFKADLDVATYIIGHNIEFDKKIVGAEMIRLGMKDELENKKSYCTMQSSIELCKISGIYGYKYPKLQELYKKLFGEDFEDAHNAMSDIEATEKCFWELRKRKLI